MSFGRTADKLFDLMQSDLEDASKAEELEKESFRLVYQAVQQCYSVTDDLLDELQWLSNMDILPICEVIFGVQKKIEEETESDKNK